MKIFLSPHLSLRAGGAEQQLLHWGEILEGRIRLAGQGSDDDKVRHDLEGIDLLYDDVTGDVLKLDVVHEGFDLFPILTFLRKSKGIQYKT